MFPPRRRGAAAYGRRTLDTTWTKNGSWETIDDVGTEEAAHLVDVDARGTYCPIPILRLAAALAGRPSGTRARLHATDPATRSDVEAFCREGGGRVLTTTEAGGVLTFEIEKAGGGRDPR